MQDTIVSDRFFTHRANGHLGALRAVAANRLVDRTTRNHAPLHYRLVLSPHTAVLQLSD